jgi:hypothetical protein
MVILYLFLICLASGVLGRMGGAHGYDTKFRDLGCSLLGVGTAIILTSFHASFWWVYCLIFLALWGAFSTYWDKVFGYDNMGFSGFVVGMAYFPLCFIHWQWISYIFGYAAALSLIWYCLNRFLPQKVFCWTRDIVEEFTRYFFSA